MHKPTFVGTEFANMPNPFQSVKPDECLHLGVFADFPAEMDLTDVSVWCGHCVTFVDASDL